VASQEEILEENRKVRRLQIAVDLVLNLVAQSDIPIEEASELVAQTRRFALNLFPDKAQVYDLIYQPKFKRLLVEKYRLV
jgi:coproporphyrinogen III oxidase-like Fe-S oxidoreductase